MKEKPGQKTGNRGELALSMVREKSEEQKIPFSHLASAFMVEEALSLLAGSYTGERFLLRNREDLKMSVYRERVVHRLLLYDQGDFDGKELKNLFHRLLERETVSGIKWSFTCEIRQDAAIFYVTGTVEKISVPFEILLSPLPAEIHAETEEFRLFFYENKRFTVRLYPKESLLSEAVFAILQKLELLGDLSYYDRTYRILKDENLDVRRVFLSLEEKWKEAEFLRDRERFLLLKSYRDYSYMKKRWNSFLKAKKRTAPAWEELMDLILSFLSPLWEAYVQNDVFFGDWISDLGRYL